MRSSRRAALAIVVALSFPVAAGAAASAALDSLVAAERAFARMSVERGAREAFLQYLAADGVIFRPLATNGRAAWETRRPSRTRLAWAPTYAEVSAAGDLGWTSGPWELTPADSLRPAAFGHFVSIWQGQPDGAWRVAVDIGVGHPATGPGLEDLVLTTGPAHAATHRTRPAADLRDLDRRWSADVRAHGTSAALERRAALDVRCYADGSPPVEGVPAALERMSAAPGAATWNPEAQRIARSGDLGCTYGTLERRAGDAAPDSSVYLHVWRREPDGRWRVALMLENPLPKPGRRP